MQTRGNDARGITGGTRGGKGMVWNRPKVTTSDRIRMVDLRETRVAPAVPRAELSLDLYL